MKKAFSLLFIALSFFIVTAATFTRQAPPLHHAIEEMLKEQAWVDSLFNEMDADERLGQLVWIRAHTDLGDDHVAQVERLISKYNPGGLCFFNPSAKGTPEKQVELTNRYQALAKRVPLFVSIDGEWGLGMRMRGTALSFPRQLMLGAVKNDRLIYQMGAEIARHCKRVGVNVNFAPVADVNNNPANPVIGFRSFGEDRYKVAAKAYMYMKGMQDNGVLACAKHFPGHGDTDVDSHYDLPVINHPISRLDSIELFPFKILIEQGVGSIMVAHLDVPSLEAAPNTPTTLSHSTISGLLRNRLHFNGLVMTDALEMKGVTKYHGPGEVEAKALLAGNDVLLLPSDVDAAFKTVKDWIKANKLDTNNIHASVKKVLRWKYRLGLTKFEPLDSTNVRADVNDSGSRAVKRQLIQNALTLVRNDGGLLPFKNPSARLASLAIGEKPGNVFQQTLGRYAAVESYSTDKEIPVAESKRWISKFKDKDAVIVSLHGMSQFANRGFGLTESTINFIEELRQEAKVVLVIFGNPYSLKYFDKVDCVLEAYEDDEEVLDLAAQALFGAFPIQGTLPVTASEKSKGGMGIIMPSLQRMSYGLPEEVGMKSGKLAKIDAIVQEAISAEAMPGCVVLVAKAGKVVFEKAYGRHTYEKDAPLTKTGDIFDLASITKIAAATVSLMKLQEAGKFSVQATAGQYLPELAGSNKADISMLDMLTHRARLTPWIKFYEKTVLRDPNAQQNVEFPKASPLPSYYSKQANGRFPLPVAKDLWLRADYPDTIWREIRESLLLNTKEYRYSDLGFYIAGEVVRRLSGQAVEIYASEQFYEPLGLQTMTYRPLEKFPADRIPPTEEDDYFRARRIQGYVHDMGAAMLNQATGHAGLFSNANDLAIMMQMLLNKGYYGGKQYLKPETIHFYTTRCEGCTRRGIGFDMRQKNGSYEGNLSSRADDGTYGHLGFTGTAVWVDPANQLIYIFLSNRTYPNMRNNQLGKMNIRVKVQDAVYEALSH